MAATSSTAANELRSLGILAVDDAEHAAFRRAAELPDGDLWRLVAHGCSWLGSVADYPAEGPVPEEDADRQCRDRKIVDEIHFFLDAGKCCDMEWPNT